MKTMIKLSLTVLLLGTLLTLSGCGYWGCHGPHGHGHHCGCHMANQ